MQGHKRPPLNAVQVAVDREGLYEICMGLSVFNVLKEERHQTIQGRPEGFQHGLQGHAHLSQWNVLGAIYLMSPFEICYFYRYIYIHKKYRQSLRVSPESPFDWTFLKVDLGPIYLQNTLLKPRFENTLFI